MNKKFKSGLATGIGIVAGIFLCAIALQALFFGATSAISELSATEGIFVNGENTTKIYFKDTTIKESGIDFLVSTKVVNQDNHDYIRLKLRYIFENGNANTILSCEYIAEEYFKTQSITESTHLCPAPSLAASEVENVRVNVVWGEAPQRD